MFRITNVSSLASDEPPAKRPCPSNSGSAQNNHGVALQSHEAINGLRLVGEASAVEVPHSVSGEDNEEYGDNTGYAMDPLDINVNDEVDVNQEAEDLLEELAKEYLEMQSDGSQKCSICKVIITKFSLAKEHLEEKHFPSINVYKCKSCNRIFNTKKTWKIHKDRWKH